MRKGMDGSKRADDKVLWQEVILNEIAKNS